MVGFTGFEGHSLCGLRAACFMWQKVESGPTAGELNVRRSRLGQPLAVPQQRAAEMTRSSGRKLPRSKPY